MKLYLIQHAESKSKDEDPERPLSEDGKVNIRKMATFITQMTNVRVKTIVHSGKLRARQTAEILAGHLEPLSAVEEAGNLEPLDDISTWVNRLADMVEDLVIVGHMPHLSKLTSFLLIQETERSIVDFKNSGIVCIDRNQSGIWSLSWMMIPQILIN